MSSLNWWLKSHRCFDKIANSGQRPLTGSQGYRTLTNITFQWRIQYPQGVPTPKGSTNPLFGMAHFLLKTEWKWTKIGLRGWDARPSRPLDPPLYSYSSLLITEIDNFIPFVFGKINVQRGAYNVPLCVKFIHFAFTTFTNWIPIMEDWMISASSYTSLI